MTPTQSKGQSEKLGTIAKGRVEVFGLPGVWDRWFYEGLYISTQLPGL